MKKSYFAKCRDVENHDPVSGPTPESVWKQLEKATGRERAWLKDFGWRVKLRVDLEESDKEVAAEVVTGVIETIAPKPVGKVIGFLKKIFG